MSFDVFLFKFAKGDGCELSHDALRGVFQKHDFKQVSDCFYNIRLQDGSEVQLYAGGLTSSERFTMATFSIRGGSDSIARLIFECAQATGGVLTPTMEENPCIMVDVSQRAELPEILRSRLSSVIHPRSWPVYFGAVIKHGLGIEIR